MTAIFHESLKGRKPGTFVRLEEEKVGTRLLLRSLLLLVVNSKLCNKAFTTACVSSSSPNLIRFGGFREPA